MAIDVDDFNNQPRWQHVGMAIFALSFLVTLVVAIVFDIVMVVKAF